MVLPLVLLGYQGAGEGWPVLNESNPEQVIKLWRSLVEASLERMSTMERRLMYPLRLQAWTLFSMNRWNVGTWKPGVGRQRKPLGLFKLLWGVWSGSSDATRRCLWENYRRTVRMQKKQYEAEKREPVSGQIISSLIIRVKRCVYFSRRRFSPHTLFHLHSPYLLPRGPVDNV